jgi:hypothetical protein
VVVLIASLSIAAVMAVVIVLTGNLGDTEARILFTTIIAAAFSLTGMGASARFYRGSWKWVGAAGIAASALALVLGLVFIWVELDTGSFLRTLVVAVILATALAYASVLLLVRPQHRAVAIALLSTLVLLAGVTVMLITLAVFDLNYQDWYFRVLGALGILTVLGTLVTPLLNRVVR